MRLLRLDLMRYGMFSDKTLLFRPDARVHVVYGGNEAGKTTALSAITDLLYGFPKSTDYDFLHEMKALRLGARIESREGKRLEFVRTKGNKNTLRMPDDTVLAEEVLEPFTGAVDRRIFLNAFGLSTDSLRAGARAMLDQEGEIGAALLGAASGMGDLQKLQRRLEDEAKDIFDKRKGSRSRFSQTRERFDAANAEMKKFQITATKWKQLNEENAALAERLAKIRQELRENTVRTNRLSRLVSVRPIINRISGHREAITALGRLPAPNPGFAKALDTELGAIATAHQTVDQTTAASVRLEAELAEISYDEPLLDAAKRIDTLVRSMGQEKDARAELSRAMDAKNRADVKLAELASELGIATQDESMIVEALTPFRLTASALALVKSLAAEGGALDSRRRQLIDQIEHEEDTLDGLHRKRVSTGARVDPAPFRAAMDLYHSDLEAIESLPLLRMEIAEETRKLTEEANRLSPPCNDVDRLAFAPRPDAETVARFGADFDKIARDRERAETAHAEARLACVTIQQELERLQADGEIATPEALASARASRDQAWQAMRNILLGQSKPSQAELGVGIAALEIAISRADSLSDAAIRDAGRIQAYRMQSQALGAAQERLKHEAEIIVSKGAELETLRDIWQGAWEDIGVRPHPPAEMRSWLLMIEGLLTRREQIELRRARMRTIEDRAEELRRPLADIAEQLGLLAIDGIDPVGTAQRISGRLDELARTWDVARDTGTLIEACRERLEKLRRSLSGLQSEIDDWHPRWSDALQSIGLASNATPIEAEAALGAFERLPAALAAHADATTRLREIETTIVTFAEEARSLVQALAGDLVDVTPNEAVGVLAKRLQDARDAQTRHSAITNRLNDANIAAAGAISVLRDAEGRLDRLTAMAGIGDDVDLVSLNRRLKARAEIEQRLADDLILLADQAEGESEDDLRAALFALDPDAASAERVELARQREVLEEVDRNLHSELQRQSRERDALEEGSNAELALQRRTNEETEMAGLTREWLVLKLAATLVSQAAARHRAGHHVPLVERAGILFSKLTGGSFVGLDRDEDETGRALLVGVRPSGEKIGISRIVDSTSRKQSETSERSRLSEGALDQLYLAMRLAYLEDFARTAEPTPFIGDDLFVTFDDARTGLGLEVLAQVGSMIQPIVFTHHRRVAEIATARLGSAADIIEL